MLDGHMMCMHAPQDPNDPRIRSVLASVPKSDADDKKDEKKDGQ